MDPAERARRVTARRKAYFERLALLSARGRRAAAEARDEARNQASSQDLLRTVAALRATADELESAAAAATT